MKKRSLALFFAFVAALVFAPANPALAAPAIGSAAPDFQLNDSDGQSRSLSEFKGKYVVLEWTNPQCPFVVKHYKSGNMPSLQKWAKEKSVVWLTIDSSAPGAEGYLSEADAKKMRASNYAAPTALLLDPDGKVGQLYGAKTTPHMFIIDPQGKLLYAGAIDSIRSANIDDIAKATNYVKVGLEEAMAGKPLTTPTSQAYGCSVKYARK
ncbi:MAG: redoxin domain-containing protein [Verrucomicrobia bacterium]|nr:redoxin domain-containing protein [Verrucomicrobiota bacterium]